MRRKDIQENTIARLRRRKHNYSEDDQRVMADAIDRVRAALSPLDTGERRRVHVAIAALFGDMPLVHAIMGTARVQAWDQHTRTITMQLPPGVHL